jgi:hypothetical protein
MEDGAATISFIIASVVLAMAIPGLALLPPKSLYCNRICFEV